MDPERHWREGSQRPTRFGRLDQVRETRALRGAEAVIKSAVSASCLGFAGERQDDRLANGQQVAGRSPADPMEAALAADLITASRSLV